MYIIQGLIEQGHCAGQILSLLVTAYSCKAADGWQHCALKSSTVI